MSIFFSGFMGNELERYDSFPMNPDKRHSFYSLYIYNASNKDPDLNSLKNVINSKLIQLLALNLILCINHCACVLPNCRTTCWQWLSGVEVNNFGRVQRRKYTILNIYNEIDFFVAEVKQSTT